MLTDEYKGMRWLKCDLHMHTAGDSNHWHGDSIILGQEADTARKFVAACCKTGLNVVAITDHNFLSKDFLPHLQTAFSELERQKNHKISLFPGFEFEAAGVGRGVHVLSLFKPDSDFSQIQSILTECGISYPGLDQNGILCKSDLNLKEILQIVQEKHNGIVILPHSLSDDGIFDNTSTREWLQQDQFTNPHLLAVEVPKPVCQMSKAFQKLFRSGDDCLQGWKRIRPIATLMSSDNKKLTDQGEDKKPTPNSIGFRYSWIKMSDPSIESLRQAFLDHESRISLPKDVSTDIHPAERERHAVIESVSVKNTAFLADQEIYFSPNMNCVIGGRGSGKSTLLEYLRIILKKDQNKKVDDNTKERIGRIQSTLNGISELKVCWKSADGLKDCIVWRQGDGSIVQGEEQPDPGTFFRNLPVHFYSQQQLSRLTEPKKDDGSERLLELLDGFAKNELKELSEQERIVKRQIQENFAKLRQAKALEEDYKRLQQEENDLTRQWKARQEIQEDAQRHQQLKEEYHYLEGLLGVPGKQFSDVAMLAESIADSHLSFPTGDLPHAVWFHQFDSKVKNAKDKVAETIRETVEQFNRDIQVFKGDDSNWPAIQKELEQADEQFRKACDDKGLTPDDVGRLQEINQSREKKQRDIEKLKGEIQEIKTASDNPEEAMQKLHQLWKEQTVKREKAASRANKLAVLNDSDRPFIEVTVQCQQDKKSFQEHWQHFRDATSVKGNTRLGKNWEDCGNGLFSLFVSKQDAESPWQLLHNLLPVEREAIELDCGRISHEELFNHIKAHPEEWEQLRCSRVQDSVDVKLYRADGSPAGSIAEGSLSDGQRNTAALALLLAQEGGPLVIDQPEDELDSNFVFNELIPMLRKVKSKRQIIMATHNANLPVNGDAELVYALEALGSKGEVRTHGGLDQHAVTQAVLDIMEGTEEAFRRRREKYHF
ncbi:MAG: TrlF family AAA-like ATPase [Candidatus Electrothrix sp. YB6]